MTKSWAIEPAPHGVRVVSLHPTGVSTPMNDGLAALESLTPLEVAERSAGNLLPVAWVEPKDVADAVVFLVSDRAKFVAGSQFVLDAGLLTRQRPYRFSYFSPASTRTLRTFCRGATGQVVNSDTAHGGLYALLKSRVNAAWSFGCVSTVRNRAGW